MAECGRDPVGRSERDTGEDECLPTPIVFTSPSMYTPEIAGWRARIASDARLHEPEHQQPRQRSHQTREGSDLGRDIVGDMVERAERLGNATRRRLQERGE